MKLTDDVWTITAKPATMEIVVRWQSESGITGHLIDHTATFKAEEAPPVMAALIWLMPRVIADKKKRH